MADNSSVHKDEPAAAPAAAAAAKEDTFACAVCTFLNPDPYATKCSACGSVNPNPKKRPAAASVGGGGGGGAGGRASAAAAGPKWSCSSCTYQNSPTSSMCWSCQTPRYPKPAPAAAAAAAAGKKDPDAIPAAALGRLGAGAGGANAFGGGGIDPDDIDPRMAAAAMAAMNGGGGMGGMGGGGGGGGMAGLAGMAAAMNGGMGGGGGGGGDPITNAVKQYGRFPIYILKGEKLLEEIRSLIFWSSVIEMSLFLLGVALYVSFLDSFIMKWVWLYSGHFIRSIIGFLLVALIPHLSQVVEIILSADRLEDGLAAVPDQMQPILQPAIIRLVFWILFAFLSLFPDMTGLIFRLMDFKMSAADIAHGEQLPWIVLFVLAVVFVACDLYLGVWLCLIWNSIPPHVQLMIRNSIRSFFGRPPVQAPNPNQPLLAAAAGGGGGGARGAQRV